MSLQTAVIYGSHRRERRGIGVAHFVIDQLRARSHTVAFVDSQALDLPMLDLMHNEYGDGEAPEAMQAVSDTLAAADGFIVVSGEYNHSVPPGLKNLLDHFQSEYLYKPSGIVTYSKGPFGGVRGLVNLRGILAELGTPAIPSAFPVSNVGDAFETDGTVIEPAYERRVRSFLDEYEWYAAALKSARQAGGCSPDQPLQQGLCHRID
jgi:NAD(P)H-dependent FMN reductase